MNNPKDFKPFLEPLSAFQRLMAKSKCQGILIGGIAVGLLGAPRLTVDIDAIVLISDENLQNFIEIAIKEGFVCRISQAQDFAKKNRVLLLRHQESQINIDVSIGLLPFEIEAVERSILFEIDDVILRLPTPEDLVILKAVAHRPKDMLDIQAIAELFPDIDKTRIKYWVIQFAELLEMPELWDDISKYFS